MEKLIMHFKIEKKLKNSLGRAGIIATPHGEIKTPAFVAVATKATVKSLSPEQIKETGVQVILGNTYHLYLRPGDEIVRDAGGIGKFMNWPGPTMTDSGGFQVFSLGAAYGKDPEGKRASYGAGISKIMKTIEIEQSISKRPAPYQAGGFGLGFDGFGIGGSFAKEDMSSAVKWVNEILPEDKPRHLLGIGEPEDLFMGIENGVDLFDCVLPTRLGRNGTIYTRNGKIIITNAKYRNDFSPIEKDCECYTCKNYAKAYVAHLFHGKEMFAGTLASIHNLYFFVCLVDKIRQSILKDNFFEFKKEFLKNYPKN